MEYSNAMKVQSPDCMASNENFYQIVIGTIVALVLLQYPVQEIANAFFMNALPAKFEKGSKLRETKARMLAERVYKMFVYSGTTGFLYYILKNGDFLHRYLTGNKTEI